MAALWKALRTLFQIPARSRVSSVSGSSALSAATVSTSGVTSAQVSS